MEVVRHHAALQKEKKQLEVAPSKNDSFWGEDGLGWGGGGGSLDLDFLGWAQAVKNQLSSGLWKILYICIWLSMSLISVL